MAGQSFMKHIKLILISPLANSTLILQVRKDLYKQNSRQ